MRRHNTYPSHKLVSLSRHDNKMSISWLLSSTNLWDHSNVTFVNEHFMHMLKYINDDVSDVAFGAVVSCRRTWFQVALVYGRRWSVGGFFGTDAGSLLSDSRTPQIQKSSPMGAFWSHSSCRKLYRSSVTPTCMEGKGLSAASVVSHNKTIWREYT